MNLHYEDDRVKLWHGDCMEVLHSLPDNSVDSVVCDPPYGLGFMGKAWDELPPGLEWAVECLRVLKPGGHLLAFGGTRTWHRLACAVEDAGFEVRDSIAWLYGSGFPKSLDVSKAIDKANGRRFEDRFALGRHIRERRESHGLTTADVNGWFGYRDGCQHWERQDRSGARVPTLADWRILRERLSLSDEHLPLVERVEAERAVVGKERNWGAASHSTPNAPNGEWDITAPATPAAEQWQGWGTALKPAFEPVVVARKPLGAGTVAANVLTHGTGALNIDGCRIEGGERPHIENAGKADPRGEGFAGKFGSASIGTTTQGRWPANVVLDESQAEALDQQSGTLSSGGPSKRDYHYSGPSGNKIYGAMNNVTVRGYPGDGGASRFFYVAKAPAKERPRTDDGVAHPTVKPLALMRWLVRLVTPPGGTVLEPFAGSGTTVEACLLEGFDCVAIEREADYLPLIEARIARVAVMEPDGPSLFDLTKEQSA